MNQKAEKEIDAIISNPEIFLNYIKAKFPIFHKSNFFLKDLQFGIKHYLEKKDIDIRGKEVEQMADKLSNHFEGQGIFIPVNSGTWKINYPDFVTKIPGDPL